MCLCRTKLALKKAGYLLSREETIQSIIDSLSSSDVVVATTGKASRELFEYRSKSKQPHDQDLLIVGGMGHASSIASAIAKAKPKRRIYCIDGDGGNVDAYGIVGRHRR